MRVFRSLERARGAFRRPIVTIGNFDGVHHGHAVILRQVREDADHRSVPAVALTFQPHPVSVLRPDKAPRLLMSLADRLAGLRSFGMDAVVVQRFSHEFAQIEADDFIRGFLVDILDVQKLVVGHDLNFGRGRVGNVERLIEAGSHHHFGVEVIQPVEVEDIVVHSSQVRKAVESGDVGLAMRLLGRPHVVRGRVVHGEGRGRKLGFATANLKPGKQMVPPDGVYVTRTLVDGRKIDGVTSIGNTPTFGGTETVIEAHMFIEAEDFYGKACGLQFIEHVRDQRKFDSPDELREQIKRDVAKARAVLAATPA